MNKTRQGKKTPKETFSFGVFCRLFYKAFERSGQFGKAVDARNRLLDRSHTVRGVDKGNLRLLAGVVIPLGVADIDRPGDLVLFHQQADVAALAKTGHARTGEVDKAVAQTGNLQKGLDVSVLAVADNI